ncbi:mitochondrial alternative oxidase [Flammula alnicola]|nr:mitochondrial alternative oxidase [Flammula alnicola]
MIRTSLIKAASPALRLTSQTGTLSALATISVSCGRGPLPFSNLRKGTTGCRQIFTSPTSGNALTDKTEHREATSPHKQELPGSSAPETSHLTKHDAVSTVPEMVRGDWVLFHPVYSPDELRAVEVLHRETKTLGDKLAYGLVKLARSIFDLVSGYKHIETPPAPGMTIEELRKAGYLLSDKQWLDRILFLETIAGVPGMVAATLRHLTSLRLMRRDSGWIHTCLEEAENERMHLMTFMTLRQPSMFFRLMILGAQGVFYNLFFLSYLISPRICHRFVGHLEEEAVVTYTRCIADLEAGKIPEWTNMPAPEISIDYWRLNDDAKLLDVIYAVRSDESTHRFVNHSLANLNPATDVNPFALREPDMHIKGGKIEFQRSESEEYVKQSHDLMTQHKETKAIPSETSA